MSKKSFFLKILTGTVFFAAFLLSLPNQTQAAYEITYDSSSFVVDSLTVDITWHAIGWGHYYPPYFAVNGVIQQYSYSPGFFDLWGYYLQFYQFTTELKEGENQFFIGSNNGNCDSCGCSCDGVWAKITFADGTNIYTDSNWRGQSWWGEQNVIVCNQPLYEVEGHNHICNQTCGDCCETNVFKNITIGIAPLDNEPPSANNLQVNQPDYCVASPSGIFSWTFTDPDEGDYQSAYRIQIDNNPDFSSPEDDSGKLISSSSSYSTPLGRLSYNNTYHWRLKVWDSKNVESDWIEGPSFSTPLHAYPSIDFSWTPQEPTVNEPVQFIDESMVFGGTSKSSWLWTFQDGDQAESTLQNPIVEFFSTEENLITLEVTDSDGYTCPAEKTISPLLKLPEWKEISPF